MTLPMIEMLHTLAVRDVAHRRTVLLSLLANRQVPVIEETLPITKYRPHNIRVPLHDHSAYWLIGAHYDNVANSPGANDNAAAVAILLCLLDNHLQNPFLPPIEFVFFDLEETEMQGSLAYTQHHVMTSVKAMLNLDLCGVGDCVLVAEGSRYRNSTLSQAIADTTTLFDYVQPVHSLPPSDDYYFEGVGVPTASICCVPPQDVDSMQILALALEGQAAPVPLPTVFETIHNRSRDTVEVVETSAMQKVHSFVTALLGAL